MALVARMGADSAAAWCWAHWAEDLHLPSGCVVFTFVVVKRAMHAWAANAFGSGNWGIVPFLLKPWHALSDVT